MPESESRELTGEPKKFSNGFQLEMDKSGSFRIVDNQGVGGDWTWYQGIALSPDKKFMAVSDYWNGVLPVETLMSIEVIATA